MPFSEEGSSQGVCEDASGMAPVNPWRIWSFKKVDANAVSTPIGSIWNWNLEWGAGRGGWGKLLGLTRAWGS